MTIDWLPKTAGFSSTLLIDSLPNLKPLKLTNKTLHLSSLGCQLSCDAHNIYNLQNVNNRQIVKWAFTMMCTGNVLMHCIPAMCPVLFKLFGFPSPKFWFLVLDIDRAWVFWITFLEFEDSELTEKIFKTSYFSSVSSIKKAALRYTHTIHLYINGSGWIFHGWCISIEWHRIFGHFLQYMPLFSIVHRWSINDCCTCQCNHLGTWSC